MGLLRGRHKSDLWQTEKACRKGKRAPVMLSGRKIAKKSKAFITLCSPVVPLLSTSKADSGLASEFRWDRAIYTAYERMLKTVLAP